MTGAQDVRGPVVAAMQAQDAGAFEDSLIPVFQQSRLDEIADLLVEALPMTWHYRHEDLAHSLQQLKYVPAIDALAEAALTKHEYLDYDNSYALARKCTWALADIGTDAAKGKLEALSRCGDPTIEGYAQKRLDSWSEEIGRRRP
ncbi:MAG: hypothetical protein R3F29_13690 [Planctomycetota bacterium]